MSEKDNNLFKRVDAEVFDKIDKVKDHPNLLTIKDFLGTLEDNVINSMKYTGTVIFLILPLLIFSVLKLLNSNVSSNIALKKEMINYSNEIIANKKVISETARRILSADTIETLDIFTSRITNIVTPLGIPLNKIQVSNFVNEVLPGNIAKSEVLIKFSDFTTEDFAAFIKSLSLSNKIKIGKIEIKRNPKKKLIGGIIKTINFSKDNSNDGY
jgi:hypothetical protein